VIEHLTSKREVFNSNSSPTKKKKIKKEKELVYMGLQHPHFLNDLPEYSDLRLESVVVQF
jgi:hypothetical protein